MEARDAVWAIGEEARAAVRDEAADARQSPQTQSDRFASASDLNPAHSECAQPEGSGQRTHFTQELRDLNL